MVECYCIILILLNHILRIPFVSAKVSNLSIALPQVTTFQDEQYLCRSLNIQSDKEINIIGFEPNASMRVVHHMLLFGCESPGSDSSVWDCNEMYGSSRVPTYPVASVCQSGHRKVIYAWAHHAPRLDLPHGVGFKVGGSTGINYLVLQVHYKDTVIEPDSSGISMITSDKKPPKTAGVLFLASNGVIRAKSAENFDITCDISEDLVLHPFAYRVHTHDRGELVSGYRIRQNVWSSIGKKSPQWPQMFYPVDDRHMTLEKDDIVAARCRMVNSENRDIYIGPRADNEMCNLYVMYWVDGDKTLKRHTCASRGPPNYYWDSDLNNIPDSEKRTVK